MGCVIMESIIPSLSIPYKVKTEAGRLSNAIVKKDLNNFETNGFTYLLINIIAINTNPNTTKDALNNGLSWKYSGNKGFIKSLYPSLKIFQGIDFRSLEEG